ncbi:hypothetical protein OF385_04760 [Glutamicibacter sp. JL.03c]|uniref:hypothetical protein n=1 Tax=Glutamicibacter sp. JL.03c TaxID=2984842 RepID=UPI0021F6B96D|nr:hypothetical protein [Glutamicibacter sp. JL.03c]UYQ78466.1 hypothetical protein OF385_04760 [Glutamicibacter sp. JL.03c]
MKKQAFWVLPVAAAFALSGCGSSGNESAGNSEGSGTAQEQSTETGALSAEQATAVVKSLVGDESNAQVLDGDTIKASLPDSQKLLEQMNIKPEKCAELVTQQGTQDLDGTNMAVAVVPGEGAETTTYSVTGFEDSAKLEQAKTMAEKKDLQGCDKFTMSMSGQEISASAKILDATSDADTTVATQTSMTVNGTEVPGGSYQLQGLVGDNAVVVAYTGGTEEKAESEVLEQLVGELNKAVAEVKSAAK